MRAEAGLASDKLSRSRRELALAPRRFASSLSRLRQSALERHHRRLEAARAFEPGRLRLFE